MEKDKKKITIRISEKSYLKLKTDLLEKNILISKYIENLIEDSNNTSDDKIINFLNIIIENQGKIIEELKGEK